MEVAATCQGDRMTIQIEQGSIANCADTVTALNAYRAAYENRWGQVDLAGRVVRIRASMYAHDNGDGTAVAGVTFDNAIELGWYALSAFPHELHHIQLRQANHLGWCNAFVPWEADELGVDDRFGCGCAGLSFATTGT